jgi:hypothetical protein
MESFIHYTLLRELIIDVLLSDLLELCVGALALKIVMFMMTVTARATH